MRHRSALIRAVEHARPPALMLWVSLRLWPTTPQPRLTTKGQRYSGYHAFFGPCRRQSKSGFPLQHAVARGADV
jgi:hypothetical protein